MSDTAKPTSFMAAMKDFFGYRPNPETGKLGTLTEFNAEIKALDIAERVFFTKGLRDNGYNVPDPVGA